MMNGVWAADNRGKGREDSEGLAHRVTWLQDLPFNLGSWNHLAHWGCQDRSHVERLPCNRTEIMVLRLCYGALPWGILVQGQVGGGYCLHLHCMDEGLPNREANSHCGLHRVDKCHQDIDPAGNAPLKTTLTAWLCLSPQGGTDQQSSCGYMATQRITRYICTASC